VTRVIAGAARGRRLAVPASGTRPTSDRVREALFSTIESEWRDRGMSWGQVRVLDLFAGSGALGLEALSRGAESAILVEKSRPAARTLTANLAAIGCPGGQVLVRDVRQLTALPVPDPADLVFLDPPYEVTAAVVRELLAELGARGWLAPGALVVVERPTRDDSSPLPDSWHEGRRRPYGDTVLWYGHFAGPEDGDDRP
jgi:16S rRNA (guanine966-N2)-methyltransferase